MLRKYGVVIMLAVLLSACQTSPTLLNPASPISNHESNLYWIILIMALVVLFWWKGL